MNSGAKRLLLLGLAVAGLLGLAIVGFGIAGKAEPGQDSSLTIEGVFPDFDPAETRYVSRCGRNAKPIRAKASGATKVAVGAGPARAGVVRIDPGVLPGEDFQIAVLDNGHRNTYRVRCLPADFPEWRFEELRPTASGLFVVSFKASRGERPWVIVFDNEGVPRWWYSPETRALWAQVLSDGTISWARSFGDGYGLDPRMAHEVRSPAGKLLRIVRTRDSIIDGHELRELESGNLLIDSYVPGKANLRRFGGPAKAAVVSAEIEELDPRGRVLWRWLSRRHIELGETGRWWRNVLSNAKPGLRALPTFDPVHINSIEPRGTDELVISTRHTDALYGIQRSSGEILWKLGGSETADSLRIVGDPARKLLGGQHDARIADDGSLSVYDNGKDRPRRPRVVFYRLDPEAGQATYLGQLNDPAVKTSHCCGSARQLADGGWLVSWGDNPLVTAFDREGRIAFRLSLAASTFRAVPAPPGATTPAELDRGLERMETSRRMGLEPVSKLPAHAWRRRCAPAAGYAPPSEVISAIGIARPAERRRVAMRQPGWTASRISLTRSPSEATVASRSGATKASPQKKAGRSPPVRSIASSGACTTSRMTSPRRKNAWRGAPAGVGSSRMRRRSRPAARSAATVRSRAELITTTWSSAVTPLGCTGCSPGDGRFDSVVDSPSSSAQSTSRSDHPVSPLAASSAASRIRVSPTTQTSPSTWKPQARQASGLSPTLSSSSVGATRTR